MSLKDELEEVARGWGVVVERVEVSLRLFNFFFFVALLLFLTQHVSVQRVELILRFVSKLIFKSAEAIQHIVIICLLVGICQIDDLR